MGDSSGTNMLKTKTTIFLESPLSKTFLFECARYYASEGYPVHYVSKYPQQDIPPIIQGVRAIESREVIYREFERITFVTAPSMKDFTEYLSYLRTLPRTQIPKAIIIENMDVFFEDTDLYQMAHLCAFVKHSVYFCSRSHDNESSLIISCKHNFDKIVIMDGVLLAEKIWRCVESKYDENWPCKYYRLINVPLNSWHPVHEEIEFSSSGKDGNGRIRLNSISRLFDENMCF